MRATTDYLIRMMLYLYEKRSEKVSTVEEISLAAHIPVRYVHTLARRLKQADMIYSLRGQFGGYHIAGKEGAISLYDIIQLTEPEKINRCLEKGGAHSRNGHIVGSVKIFYQLQQESWDRDLKSITLKFISSNPSRENIIHRLKENGSKGEMM